MSKQFSFLVLRLALSVLCVLYFQATNGQDPKRQYKNAKDFFVNGKFNLAMEAFKPLLAYDKNNPYSEYASFYYAQAAMRQNYLAVAKDMLMQVKKLYPSWDQMNEVNFWLAKIYFDRGEYFQGMHILKEVKLEDFIDIQENAKMKRYYLTRIKDPEILRMMWEEYPDDAVVGNCLAWAISRQNFSEQDKVLLDSAINRFKLPREQFANASSSQPVFKEQYSVSVLFPFLTSSLEPSPNKKQNQLVLDLYEGMRIANDTLRKRGTHINLLAYDTERNPSELGQSKTVMKKLLDTEELKNTDLIIGPLFPEETRMVQEFSEHYQINMINPVSYNLDYVGQNPFALLFQPSLETMGTKSAELLGSRIKNKNCIVMYGDKLKDSVMAASFSNRAKEAGLNVVWSEEFSKETAVRIISILATPTEFDEFKNPKQFKLKLDSIGSIFVASDDPLIYTKVISSVEARGDSVVIVGSETWLDNTSVDLTKYERLHVMLAAPTYTPLRQSPYLDFRKSFIRTHGSFPPQYMNYSKLGYDFMMLVGNVLKKYGVYFQEDLIRDGLFPGCLTKGYRLSARRDNQEVPFIYFHNGELNSIE